MKGDAREYLKHLKDSLLAEVKAQRIEGEDYEYNLIESITTYLNMFNSGFTKKSIQCSVCNVKRTEEETPFQELLLAFDPRHHDDNNKSNSCTLGELLTTYFAHNDNNTEHECQACNKSTRSVVQHCISRHPEILCICLCRGKIGGKILSSVDFPVENFKPNEILGVGGGTEDTTYDLVASVNHQTQPNNLGHWTAICQQNVSGIWYEYNDKRVTNVSFIKNLRGVKTVKKPYQRLATILFYMKKGELPSLADTSNLSEDNHESENDHGVNSDEKSNQSNRSRFSYDLDDDNDIPSEKQNDVRKHDVGCNSDQTTLKAVSIPVISEPNELHHVIISIHSRH